MRPPTWRPTLSHLITGAPAAANGVDSCDARRGQLRENDFADVVLFDPNTTHDPATYEDPQQYATGMAHVFVNGVQVLKNGNHTGAKPGQFVRGPEWNRRKTTGG
jgi:N-acyl-D-amino-acid deacylase